MVRNDCLGEPYDQAFRELLVRISDLDNDKALVVIDGRSGSGKSTLAEQLVAVWPRWGSVELIALDHFYPGWNGLEEGSEIAHTKIALPHVQGLPGQWYSWDWERMRRGKKQHSYPLGALVLEGSGAMTKEIRALADLSVWVEAGDEQRKFRALQRDGETYRPHWEQWSAQEVEHIKHHSPADHADVIICTDR